MKKFLIIGNQNACIYKEFFPYFKEGKVCTGYNHIKEFVKPDNTIQKFGNICWFSNLYIYKENDLVLSKTYDVKVYPFYDNYDAINTDKIKDIPIDYDGAIGVPITILDKVSTGGIIHLNQDYSIKGTSSSNRENTGGIIKDNSNTTRAIIDGEYKYPRILIQKADYSINEELADNFLTTVKGKPKFARVIIKKK